MSSSDIDSVKDFPVFSSLECLIALDLQQVLVGYAHLIPSLFFCLTVTLLFFHFSQLDEFAVNIHNTINVKYIEM